VGLLYLEIKQTAVKAVTDVDSIIVKVFSGLNPFVVFLEPVFVLIGRKPRTSSAVCKMVVFS
jgi:hypothetical protein